MKKTYTAPMLVESGDVVDQTRVGEAPISESTDLMRKNPLAGGTGYFL